MQPTGKFTVSEAPKGVYIFTESKNCIVPKFWGLYEKEENPVGAIILSDYKMIVALTGSKSSIPLLNYGINQENLKYESLEDALKDFNGKDETKVLAHLGSVSAKFCLEYSCGNIQKGEWHLPSMGELQIMFTHKKELDIALAICGGNAIETDDWHWSSTRRYDKSNWVLSWGNGNRNYYVDPYDYNMVRPVSAL